MKEYKRSERVSQQIKKILSQEISLIIPEAYSILVTITEVILNQDASSAKIFISSINENIQEVEELIYSLNKKAYMFRSILSRKLYGKRTPSLLFLYDSSLLKTNKLLELIDKIKY